MYFNPHNKIILYHADCVELMDKWIGCEECGTPEEFDIIIVDPPFGIDYKKDMGSYNRDRNFVIDYKDISGDNYSDFTKDWMEKVTSVLKPNGILWVVSGWTNVDIIRGWARYYGYTLINEIIWKHNFGMFHKGNKFISSHYNISLFVKNPKDYHLNPEANFEFREGRGNNKQNYADREDVWMIPKEYRPKKKKTATMLPSALIEKMLKYTAKEGDVLLDPMCGSGMVLRVSSQMGLRCVGIEIDKEVFDFAKQFANGLID